MIEEQNAAFHFLARRLVAQWANKRDPDLIVKQRDDAKVPKMQKETIRDVAESLRRAFEADDEYKRDWFLTWARCLNAKAVLRGSDHLKLADVPGVIPMAQDSTMERAIYYVQKHAASAMRVCPECKTCFFQRKAKQKLCGKTCRLASIAESRRTSWQRNGKRWRPT